jgi:hypothetical protein
MSCVPWGYANRVAPMFLPDTGANQLIPDNMIVSGNAIVSGGLLNVGGSYQEQGGFIKLSPVPLLVSRKPPAYVFQTTPDILFKLKRENVPDPATASNSTIMQFQSAIQPGSIANYLTLNAQLFSQNAFITNSVVSGFSGMRYNIVQLGASSGVIPQFNFIGATFLIQSYDAGNGAGYVILPSDFTTNGSYNGSILLRFINSASAPQVIPIYASNRTTLLLTLRPASNTVTECVITETSLIAFSYAFTNPVPPLGESLLSAPSALLETRTEDLPLAKPSKPLE